MTITSSMASRTYSQKNNYQFLYILNLIFKQRKINIIKNITSINPGNLLSTKITKITNEYKINSKGASLKIY